MIYFLVNNDYHLLDVYRHLDNLKSFKKSLIQIPHRLNLINEHPQFEKIYTIESPFKNLNRIFNIFKILGKVQKNPKLNIEANDILFLYTEYELLNQIIISKFKKRGAKVFLIEEGFATYLTYTNNISDSSLTFKEKIQLFYLNYILRYPFINFLKINNVIFPLIDDKFLDGVLLYMDIQIKRNIKKFHIHNYLETLHPLDNKKAIFLNERIYDYYCNKREFENILDDVISKISSNFEMVFFKFHPSETLENRKWIKELLKKFDNINIINEEEPIEMLIGKYRIKFIFSFISAALLNLYYKGATPVYIFHLYNSLTSQKIFKNIKSILENLRYNFLEPTFSNIDYVGFTKQNTTTGTKLSLREIIEQF